MPGTAGPRFGDGVAMAAAAAAVGRPGLPVPARRLHAAAAGPTTPSAIPIVSKPIVILGGVRAWEHWLFGCTIPCSQARMLKVNCKVASTKVAEQLCGGKLPVSRIGEVEKDRRAVSKDTLAAVAPCLQP